MRMNKCRSHTFKHCEFNDFCISLLLLFKRIQTHQMTLFFKQQQRSPHYFTWYESNSPGSESDAHTSIWCDSLWIFIRFRCYELIMNINWRDEPVSAVTSPDWTNNNKHIIYMLVGNFCFRLLDGIPVRSYSSFSWIYSCLHSWKNSGSW